MKRRTFVGISVTGMLGLLFSATSCTHSVDKKLLFLSKPITLSSIFELSLIDYFGEKYLNEHPRYNSLRALQTELLNGIHVDINHLKEEEMNQHISKKIRMNFKNGRIVHSDGWVLSETELQQCALSFLIN